MRIEDELKQSKFASPQHKAVVNVLFTSGWVSNHFREIFRNHDLTLQQYNVLRILRGKYPEALNPSEIKSVMIDKNPDLTRLCDRLLTRNLIDRCVDSENRRKMNIRITEEGLQILNQIDPVMDEYNNSMESLTNEEAQHLSDLLDKLRA